MSRRPLFKLFIQPLLTFLILCSCSSVSIKNEISQTPPETPRAPAQAIEDLNSPWAYDPGPNPHTAMGKELIDLVAEQPHMPTLSSEIAGSQKFRPAFGPTLWRMIQTPNSVKILFIGQDGTHIAEAAGRTATAGFGGRAQDLAAHFGVSNSAAFINTFAFTIGGQYSTMNTPLLSLKNQSIEFKNITDNGMWLLAQDLDSPMVQWRNHLIDWILRNNKSSLKMIVVFGQAAKDAIATYILSKGGKVEPFTSESSLQSMVLKIPVVKLTYAGGNNKYPVLLDQENGDLSQGLLGSDSILDYERESGQKAAREILSQNFSEVLQRAKVHQGGLLDSGIVHSAQIGGYNLNKILINGFATISLKGLHLDDGSEILQDVLVADFPHPTYLSNVEMENAEKRKKNPQFKPEVTAASLVAAGVKDLDPYAKEGWIIEPDPGLVNKYSKGLKFEYGRTDIGPAFYDFGTPKNRMVSKSDAVRLQENLIVLGTRERASFNSDEVAKLSESPQPEQGLNPEDMFSARPRNFKERYSFDPGPGPRYARLMKQNLDLKLIGHPKPGHDPQKEFMAAYNIKTHPSLVGDFAHYRGRFNSVRGLILADPDGSDDILTSKALTGARGQYLHGLMEDLGIGADYLVLRTVPFGMDGANESEWKLVVKQTQKYREELFKAILNEQTPLLILADGPYASREIKSLTFSSKTPVVTIDRTGSENASGLSEAFQKISQIPEFSGRTFRGAMAKIPRSHLSFFSRTWEGVGGSHVLNSTDVRYYGIAFAIVAPRWSYKQEPILQDKEKTGLEKLKQKIDSLHLIYPKEDYHDYLKRLKKGALLSEKIFHSAA